MKTRRHISLDHKKMKEWLVSACREQADTTETLLNAVSSRLKNSLRNISRKRHAEIEALIETSLQERLEPVFRKIVSTHCVISPEDLEILTKEAAAKFPSQFAHKLSSLSTEIDAFTLNQRILYEKYALQAQTVAMRVFGLLKEALELILSQCTKAHRKKKIKNPGLEPAFFKDSSILQDISTFSAGRKESSLMLGGAVEKKGEMRTRKNISDLEGPVLEGVLEMIRSGCSNGRSRSSLYFYLKEITENNGKSIDIEKIDFLRKHTPNNPERIFSVGEFAERIKTAENECLREGRRLSDRAKEVEEKAREIVYSMREHFEHILTQRLVSEIMQLVSDAEKEAGKLQGPEKTEMEKMAGYLKSLVLRVELFLNSSGNLLNEVSRCFNADYLHMKLSGRAVARKFARFNGAFEKIRDKFPNAETNLGFAAALQNLIDHQNAICEKTEQIHGNAKEAENCLMMLAQLIEGETLEARDLRVSTYEKFADATKFTEFSGSIKDITSNRLEDGVTPREIRVMLSSLKIYEKTYTRQLKAEYMPKTDAERLRLEESLSEIEENVQFLEQKLSLFGDLSEEQAQKEECLRYAYLHTYKSSCLSHMDLLREKLQAEMVLLSLEVMEKIKETPNNPELIEKVKNRLEDALKNEPLSLLTAEFAVENEYFWEELANVVDQLDKEIAEVLKKGSDEGTRSWVALQSSIFGLFFVFMLLSLGLMYNSGTA
ncbi:uncharacterized protein NEMAJ01_1017 [Nematocida major]|uniref:uncharacterized protein n=1 Tax=Nematocida major TaxID=1912982 RepID=UPI00200853D9|nr:uncharacterized protein NEMAJ01_1017 [Nematocida major]KAH9386121.1 hypothetical protein NEMAJ01_1017 [Nematocida major]